MSGSLDRPRAKDYIGNMAHVSIDLPPDLQRHLDARAADGGFGDSAAYLRALAEQDHVAYRRDVARVQALIDEGFASGVIDANIDEIFDQLIAEDPDLRA